MQSSMAGPRSGGSRRAATLMLLLAGMIALPGGALAQSTTPPTPGINPAFKQVWERTDLPVAQAKVQRSWVWGPSPIATKSEPLAEATGGVRQVQYYDKGRMEINDPKANPASPWFVTSGLLVYEMLSGKIQVGADKFEQRDPANLLLAGDPQPNANPAATGPTFAILAKVATLSGNENQAKPRTGQEVDQTLAADGTVGTVNQVGPGPASLAKYAYYEATTGHNVPDVFWSFMNQSGLVYENGQLVQGQLFNWVYTMGYPLTEPYWITAYIGGKQVPVLVQAFQRRLLTFTPGNTPAWQVEMGNAGLDYLHWRYGPQEPSRITPGPVGDLGILLTSQRVDLPSSWQPRQYSNVHTPTYSVVTNENDWAAMWAQIAAGNPQAGPAAFPPPKVDFANAFIAAAFAGDKPNACYSLEIQGVYLKGDTITVVVSQKGGPLSGSSAVSTNCAAVITQPYDVLTVSRFNLTQGRYNVVFADPAGQQLGTSQLILP